MGNREKGEVSFEVDGKQWVLRYSTNALCALEDVAGMGALGYVQSMETWEAQPDQIEIRKLRNVIWAGLTDHQPDVSLEQAGSLMSEVGIQEIMLKFMEAFQLAFPQAEDDDAENPPIAAT